MAQPNQKRRLSVVAIVQGLLVVAFLAWRFAGDEIHDFYRWRFTRAAAKPAVPAVYEELTDIDVVDEPLGNVFEALAKRHGIKITWQHIDPDPLAELRESRRITCRMSRVRLQSAIQTLASLTFDSGEVEFRADSAILKPPNSATGHHETRLHPLNRWLASPHEISADELADAIRGLGSVTVSTVPGGIVATSSPEMHAAIDRLIDLLSRPADEITPVEMIWPLPHRGDAAVFTALDDPLGFEPKTWSQAGLEIAKRHNVPLLMDHDSERRSLVEQITPHLSLRTLCELDRAPDRKYVAFACRGSLMLLRQNDLLKLPGVASAESWRLYSLHDLIRRSVRVRDLKAKLLEQTRRKSHSVQGWWLVHATDSQHAELENALSRVREAVLGVDPAKPQRLQAIDRVAAALETPVSFDWNRVRGVDAARELAKRIDVPIWLPFAPETVSLSCRDEPAGNVLQRLLEPEQMTFGIRHGLIETNFESEIRDGPFGMAIINDDHGRLNTLHVIRMPYGGAPFVQPATTVAPHVFAVSCDHRSFRLMQQHVAAQARALNARGDAPTEPLDLGRHPKSVLLPERRIQLYPIGDLTTERWPAREQELAGIVRHCSGPWQWTSHDLVQSGGGVLAVSGPPHLHDVTRRLLAAMREAKGGASRGPWTMEIAPEGEQAAKKLLVNGLAKYRQDAFVALSRLASIVPVGSLETTVRWAHWRSDGSRIKTSVTPLEIENLLAAKLLKPLYRENVLWIAEADAPDEVPEVRIHEIPELFATIEGFRIRQGAAKNMRVIAKYLSNGNRTGTLVDDLCKSLSTWLAGGTVARFDRWLFVVGPPAYQKCVDELLAELQPLVAHGLSEESPHGDGIFLRGYQVPTSPNDWLEYRELVEVARRMLNPRYGDVVPLGHQPPRTKTGIADVYDFWLVRDTARNHARIRRLLELFASKHPLGLRNGPEYRKDDPFAPNYEDWVCERLKQTKDETERDFCESYLIAPHGSRSPAVSEYLSEQLPACQPERSPEERQRTYRLCRALAVPVEAVPVSSTPDGRLVEWFGTRLESERELAQRGCYLRAIPWANLGWEVRPNEASALPQQEPTLVTAVGESLLERRLGKSEPSEVIRLSPFFTSDRHTRQSPKAGVLRHMRPDQPYRNAALLSQYRITTNDLNQVADQWEQSADPELHAKANVLRAIQTEVQP